MYNKGVKMKKNAVILFAFFIVILFIITVVFLMKIDSLGEMKKETSKETVFFEEYKDKKFDVTDFISIMSKAIDNNENHDIKKDSEGMYIEDNKYSIKVYLRLDNRDKLIPMESLMQSEGGGSYVVSSLFNEIIYKYESIDYHEESGRIKEIIVSGSTITSEMNLGIESK